MAITVSTMTKSLRGRCTNEKSQKEGFESEKRCDLRREQISRRWTEMGQQWCAMEDCSTDERLVRPFRISRNSFANYGFTYCVLWSKPIVIDDEWCTYDTERVAPYKRLRGGVRFVKELPRSPSGKLLRNEMVDSFFSKHSGL